jgi:hypothetical protein
VGAPRLDPTGELAALADLLGRNGGEPDEEVLVALRRELTAVLDWAPLRHFAAAQRVVDWPEFASFTGKLAGLSIGRAVGDSMRRHGTDEASRGFVVGV